MRNRIIGVVASVALLLGLGAGAAFALGLWPDNSGTANTAFETTSPPRHSPTPETAVGAPEEEYAVVPAPTGDPTPQDPDDPGTWIVDGGGIGQLRIGTAFDASAPEAGPYVAEQILCPNPAVSSLAADGFAPLTVVTAEGGSDIVLLQVTKWDTSVDAASPATAQGVKLGMGVEELQAAYPGIQSNGVSNNSTTYAVEDGDGWIVFWTLDDQIVLMASSAQPILPSELCG